MGMILGHPAPGLGDLLPGSYVVPQNPLQGITYVPRIGEILPGAYVVPQNPIKDYMAGRLNLIGREPGAKGTVNGISGVGCGCGGGCGACGGLGSLSDDWSAIQANITAGDYMGALQSTVFGVPVWAIAAGLGVMFFMGGESHSYYGRSRRAAAAARRAYA